MRSRPLKPRNWTRVPCQEGDYPGHSRPHSSLSATSLFHSISPPCQRPLPLGNDDRHFHSLDILLFTKQRGQWSQQIICNLTLTGHCLWQVTNDEGNQGISCGDLYRCSRPEIAPRSVRRSPPSSKKLT